jgi:hypothetical protein
MALRKSVLGSAPEPARPAPEDRWLDIARAARVEVTSEDPTGPIEAALVPGGHTGWRAAGPGPQTIRLYFDRPERLRRVDLLFVEPQVTRTQEFVLRWSPDGGRSFRDVVRQQWNFSPDGSVHEAEDFHVDLQGVTALELSIVPDVSGGDARASLARWRVA